MVDNDNNDDECENNDADDDKVMIMEISDEIDINSCYVAMH
jgi:hypothetical protein